MRGGQSPRGQHRAAQRKRQREDGVLPFDHLQRYAQAAKDGHESIVMQGLDAYYRKLRNGIADQRHKTAELAQRSMGLAVAHVDQLQLLRVC